MYGAFDAWMVTEHKRRFEGNDLSQTYSRATIINGLVAVAAGCLGQWASDIAGPVAPFDLAILFLLLGAVLVSATWPENYGDDAPASPHSGVSASLKIQAVFRGMRGRMSFQMAAKTSSSTTSERQRQEGQEDTESQPQKTSETTS